MKKAKLGLFLKIAEACSEALPHTVLGEERETDACKEIEHTACISGHTNNGIQ